MGESMGMNRALQVSLLKELMSQLDEGRNIDAGVQYVMPTTPYICPDVASKEWQVLFRNHPQLVGLSGDLPKADSFFTLNDFGVPILATRDKDGVFHAFLNACRHRGVQVTNEVRGEKKRFTCPFHAWTYSAQGKLLAIPEEDHFGEIDKSCHGLIRLPAIERNGLLWVHPQPEGELDIDNLLGSLSDEIASLDFGSYIYAGGTEIDMKLNWKLANDTFGETYHFQKLHKNTLGQIFYGNNLAYEEFGKNHRFVTASKQIYTLRDKPESEWRLTDGAFLIYYLFPNIQIVVNAGRVNLVRIYPDPENPARSITRITSYFDQVVADVVLADQSDDDIPKVTADNVYDASKPVGAVATLDATLEVFYSTVAQEDYVMGEYQQRAAQSGLLPHVIFGRNEPALHHFHQSFRKAIGLAPLEKINFSQRQKS